MRTESRWDQVSNAVRTFNQTIVEFQCLDTHHRFRSETELCITWLKENDVLLGTAKGYDFFSKLWDDAGPLSANGKEVKTWAHVSLSFLCVLLSCLT